MRRAARHAWQSSRREQARARRRRERESPRRASGSSGGRDGERHRPTPSRTRIRRTSASSRRAAARPGARCRATRSCSRGATPSPARRTRSRAARERNACESSGWPGRERVPIRGGNRRDVDVVAHDELHAFDCRVRGASAQGRDVAHDGANAKMTCMHIAVAQLDQVIGDLTGNAAAILRAVGEAKRAGARLVVTPELSLPGYPPEDLLLRPAFIDACARELAALAAAVSGNDAARRLSRARGRQVLQRARRDRRRTRDARTYRKQCLPNYTVFDEERYFEPGTAPCVVDIDGLACGLIICEDVWFPGPARQAREAGARLLVVANGSPYHTKQQALRRAARRRARARNGPPDRLREPRRRAGRARVRRRLVRDRRGRRSESSSCPAWHEAVAMVRLDDGVPKPVRGSLDARLEAHVYAALVMGVRDYVRKNRFPGVLLGLSGGVDSALVLAVAVDALGRDAVRAVMLPSPYTRPISVEDARTMAGALRRPLRRDPDRAGVRRVPRHARGRVPRPARRMPPRKTSRRAFAARC